MTANDPPEAVAVRLRGDYLDALSDGNAQAALDLARRQPQLIREEDPNVGNILHLLCSADRGNDIAEAIRLGADVNGSDVQRQNPLHVAVHHENQQAVEVLLRSGASSSPNEYGETPLDAALSRGNRTLVGMLLAAGATPSRSTGDRSDRRPEESSAASALRGASLECVEMIIESGVTLEEIVEAAIALRDCHWVQWSLERAASCHEPQRLSPSRLLLQAVRSGDSKVVETLLSLLSGRLTPERSDAHPLNCAVLSGSHGIADALVAHGFPFEPIAAEFATMETGLRRKVVEYLEGRTSLVTVEFFTARLSDPDEEIRWRTARILGALGDNTTTPSLIGALSDSSRDVRWQAAASLELITGVTCRNDAERRAWWAASCHDTPAD